VSFDRLLQNTTRRKIFDRYLADRDIAHVGAFADNLMEDDDKNIRLYGEFVSHSVEFESMLPCVHEQMGASPSVDCRRCHLTDLRTRFWETPAADYASPGRRCVPVRSFRDLPKVGLAGLFELMADTTKKYPRGFTSPTITRYLQWGWKTISGLPARLACTGWEFVAGWEWLRHHTALAEVVLTEPPPTGALPARNGYLDVALVEVVGLAGGWVHLSKRDMTNHRTPAAVASAWDNERLVESALSAAIPNVSFEIRGLGVDFDSRRSIINFVLGNETECRTRAVTNGRSMLEYPPDFVPVGQERPYLTYLA